MGSLMTVSLPLFSSSIEDCLSFFRGLLWVFDKLFFLLFVCLEQKEGKKKKNMRKSNVGIKDEVEDKDYYVI